MSNPVAGETVGEPRTVPPLAVRVSDSHRTLTEAREYQIGRAPGSDIHVDDARVSWHHAVLKTEGSVWVLQDSGSTNGTFLGDDQTSGLVITQSCDIRLGDAQDGPVLHLEPVREKAQAGAEARRGIEDEYPATARVSTAGRRQAPSKPLPEVPRVATRLPGPDGPGAAVTPREPLPRVDLQPSVVMPIPARVLRIGRTPDNDVVVGDLSVSRHHAELRRSDAGFEIIDLGSHNGTFVNGRRVTQAAVSENDLVAIGNATFRLAGGELRQYIDTGEVSLQCHDLTVMAGHKVLLDSVSFPIPERSLLAVIGPSGAGKSTLLGALTGTRPADSGTVLYDNRNLYQHYEELKNRIGLVPQQSILHTQLTPAAALKYAAELRFPRDTKPAERKQRVAEVLAELGLSKHARTRADRLSGGQLKRVNVATELLTKPSLLFLDEPTSGLDPGLDKSVMEQMRDLAHEGDGRTVVVVTHSVDNLDTCDRLLVLVPGGRIAYYGPPEEGLPYFGKQRWAEVFQAFEAESDRDWDTEFKRSPEYERYVAEPSAGTAEHVRQQAQEPAPAPAETFQDKVQDKLRAELRQLWTLSRRYLRVLSADRGFLLFSGLLPLLLGILIRFVPSPRGLAGGPASNAYAQELLLVLVISACLAGAANSVRELVKERDIYLRERSAGLESGAYLASKVLVLGVVSVIQAVIMTALGLSGRHLPSHGAVLAHAPLNELMIGMAVLAFSSMCLGLLISALVSTSEKAMPVLVVLTMLQVVLSGAIFSLVGKAGMDQLAWLSPSRWGMGALASTCSLNVISPSMATSPDSAWSHGAGTWVGDILLTLLLGLVFMAASAWRLYLLTPGRRR